MPLLCNQSAFAGLKRGEVPVRKPCEFLKRRLSIFVAYIVPVGLVVVLGCSQAARDNAKHFFFEIPEETQAETASRNAEPTDATARPDIKLPPSAYASVHEPYARDMCAECHDSSAKMPGLDNLTDACGECHSRYFSDEVAHSVVSDGECLSCHQLHRSKLTSLLTRSAAALCADCHDDPADLSEEAHGVEGVERCTTCHDPHFGGEDEMLLRPDRPRPGTAS